jgi:hypothetical protein
MTLLAGHITPEQAESSDSTIGIEFDGERNVALFFVDEGQGCTEYPLTYRQARQLVGMASQVVSQMEWHNARWVYAQYSTKKYHLMEKGKHGESEKTLCGALPPSWGDYTSKWTLAPVVEAPWRNDGMCKRCLAIYDKRNKEQL